MIGFHYSTVLGGGTIRISFFTLFSRFFTIVTCWVSRSYLTGVAAAQLRRHLSNMKVIQRTFSHKFKIFALQRNLQKNERSFIWSCLSTGDRFLCRGGGGGGVLHLVCYHNQIGNMNLISIIILVRGWVSDMVWIVRCLLSYMIRRQILTKHYWPRWTHPLSEIHDTTWHEKARHITGLCGGNFPHYWPLWGRTTGHLWIPLINASNWKLWSFLLMSTWTSCSRNNQVAVDSRRKNAHVTSQFCHFLIAFKELL